MGRNKRNVFLELPPQKVRLDSPSSLMMATSRGSEEPVLQQPAECGMGPQCRQVWKELDPYARLRAGSRGKLIGPVRGLADAGSVRDDYLDASAGGSRGALDRVPPGAREPVPRLLVSPLRLP